MDALAWDLSTSLALLTAALDDPDADLAAEVVALTAHARTFIDSCVGLTINIAGDPPATLTSLAAQMPMSDIHSSIRIELRSNDTGGAGVDFLLYAHQPGAFVDLAADLAWTTGRESTEFQVDQHLKLPVASGRADTPLATSLINQAIGVLVGRGSTPAAALRELDSHACSNAIARVDAAVRILEALPAIDPLLQRNPGDTA